MTKHPLIFAKVVDKTLKSRNFILTGYIKNNNNIHFLPLKTNKHIEIMNTEIYLTDEFNKVEKFQLHIMPYPIFILVSLNFIFLFLNPGNIGIFYV